MAKKHWIYLKRGLSEDPKHRAAMGECIWLFMHIIDRADWETGIAFDWKDKEEAADMGMPLDTLRRQRQKLEELDYIRTRQKQHSQDVSIMEWKNPRDYGAETKNPRSEGSHESPPSTSQGLNQGSNEGLNQGSNQVQAQVRTPTSNSKSDSRVRDQHTHNFKTMTIPEARKVPTLRMYFQATDFFPGSILWEYVDTFIRENNLTETQLHTAAVEWVARGYKTSNVKGILDVAAFGWTNGNGNHPVTPKGFTLPKPTLVCGEGEKIYTRCKSTYGTGSYEANLTDFRRHIAGCHLCGGASNSNDVSKEIDRLSKRMAT